MNDANCEEFIIKFSNHSNIRTNIANRAIYDEMVNSGILVRSIIKRLNPKLPPITNYPTTLAALLGST